MRHSLITVEKVCEVGWSAVNLYGLMHLSMLSPTTSLQGMGGGTVGFDHPKIQFYHPQGKLLNQISIFMWGQWGLECGNVTHSPFCRTNMWNLSCARTVQNFNTLGWLHFHNYYQPPSTHARERVSGAILIHVDALPSSWLSCSAWWDCGVHCKDPVLRYMYRVFTITITISTHSGVNSGTSLSEIRIPPYSGHLWWSPNAWCSCILTNPWNQDTTI